MLWFLAFQFIDGNLIGCIVDMGYRNVHLQEWARFQCLNPAMRGQSVCLPKEALVDYVYPLDCGSVKTEYCDTLLKLGEVLTELHIVT